jgi:hypothetical protein
MKLFKLLFAVQITLTATMVFAQNIEKASILVLATPHLRVITEGELDKSLKPLNNRLLNYKPDAVCLEIFPPVSIDALLNDANPNAKKILDYFAGNTVKAGRDMQKRLNQNSAKSRRISDSLTDNSTLTDQKTRHLLIDNLIAGYDYYSALLNLMYLDKRYIDDNKLEKDTLYSVLFSELNRNTEQIKLGLNTAHNLKQTRVYGIDNHTDDYYLMDYPESFYNDLQNSTAYKEFDKKYYDNLSEELKKQISGGDVTPVYEYYNGPEYRAKDVEKQWSIFLNNNLKSGLDRARYNLWEQRNILICADIMHVASLFPKKNILVIIGASHKQFLDKYLQNAPDIKVVNLKDIN